MNTHEMRIDASFKELKMPGAGRSWRSLMRDAETKGQDHGAFLAALLEAERISRRENRLRMLLAEAHFPEAKTLDTFDFTAQPSVPKTKVLALSRADFLKQRESVVCIGPPGTGKTHLSSAIGVSCIHAGFRVRFTTVTALANDLLAARDNHTLTRAFRKWQRYSLVILDELGFVPLSRDGAQVLFQFISDRYDNGKSLVITTNLEFSKWTEVLHDPQMTAALLDRLTHRCHIFEHKGESYRFRESMKKKGRN
jgi:DNA replication protein DnaC